MTDSVYTSFGGLSLPVSTADASGSLVSLDPARDRILEWFKAAINAEFSNVWDSAVSALPGGSQLFGTLPVQDVMPFEPTPKLMKERKAGFPLLALQRTGAPEFSAHTLEEDRMTQNWHLHYIFGTMDLEGQRKILDIGQAIGKMLRTSIRCFGHPAYESGANQIEAASLASLELTGWSGVGAARFDGDEDSKTYWAARYNLVSTEDSEPLTEQMSEFDGADLSVDVGGPEILPDFVEASW